MAPETIADYRCESCNAIGPILRQLRIWSPPRALVIHLKRYEQRDAAGAPIKICTPVRVPQVLEIAPFCDLAGVTAAGSSTAYKLAAVSIHDGPSASSGHYMTAGRAPSDGLWRHFSDSYVSTPLKIGADQSVTTCAYLATYVIEEDSQASCDGVVADDSALSVAP